MEKKHTLGRTNYGDDKMTASDESVACYIDERGFAPMRVHVRGGRMGSKPTKVTTLQDAGEKVDTIFVQYGQTTFYLPIDFARAIAYEVDEVDRAEAEQAQCAKAGCNGDHSATRQSMWKAGVGTPT